MNLSYTGSRRRRRDKMRTEAWQSLVHVCRRWRGVVFESPRRLNLQLYCGPKTPVKEKLDVWPALPFLVCGDTAISSTDNVTAALGRSNRVRQVNLRLGYWQLEGVLAAMQVPFPELTDLRLSSSDSIFMNLEPMLGIPDSFLDGSAPRLRNLTLRNIAFPGLPKLLLSACHLVGLYLSNIPDTGYIPPEAMIDLLSELSRLKILRLEYQPIPYLYRESRSPPPPKHAILPSLGEFRFTGFTGYLEALVTHIDTPQLDEMHISFINSSNFDCPRLAQFINRTPTLRARDKAHLQFVNCTTSVALLARSSILKIETLFSLETFVRGLCNSSLHPLSTVEDLYIEHQHWNPRSPTESTQLLELLLPFTAVKNLFLPKELAPGISAALQELVGDRISEVLPSLQNIFVQGLEPSGPFQEKVGHFVAARQLSNHPVDIFDWEQDPDMESM
jgi:hypothetical protein